MIDYRRWRSNWRADRSQCVKSQFVIDELGYLPFSQSVRRTVVVPPDQQTL